MKTRSKILSKAILCVLLAALTLVICFPVAAATNSTTLTTTVPETFPLMLELSGNGTVTINGVAYTQSNLIDIPHNSNIELLIVPDAENDIKTVVYNDCDYTKDTQNGKLTLPPITGDATLRVGFSKSSSIPATGDSHYFALLYLVPLMLFALIGIIAISLLWKKKSS